MSPREKAQEGRGLIKSAIVELLMSKRGAWCRRSEIEEDLGVGSNYTGSVGRRSYEGGFAAMLLSELYEEKLILRERASDGRMWLYRALA